MKLPFARFPPVASGPSVAAARTAAAQPASSTQEAAGIRALGFALLFAVVMSVFEGPIRYALNLVHLDSLVFVRDALLAAALLAFIAVRVPARAVPASVGIFAVLALVHGTVSYFNLHTPIAAVYGLKLFVPGLCGFLAAAAIFRPGPIVLRLIAVMWVASVIGAAVDRFWIDYPWVGMNVDLGGVSVYLGRDWQSTLLKRVGGLTRSSINLAIDLPLLSFMLMTCLRSRVARAVVAALTITVLVWTTQKGAILAYALAVLALLLSNRKLTTPLKAAVVFATVVMIFAPTVLVHYTMPRDNGMFSLESFYERIGQMWPDAWAWIGRFPPYVLGVGLGGIGGAQRFFAPEYFNAADNLFVYLFASFGVASLAYLGAVVLVALNAQVRNFRRDGVVLASLVFLLMYGFVVSLVEDQIAALWLGATLGWLAGLQPAARAAAAAASAARRHDVDARGGAC